MNDDTSAETPAKVLSHSVATEHQNALEPIKPTTPAMSHILAAFASGRRIATVEMMLQMPEYGWLGSEVALRHILFQGTPMPDIYGNPRPTNGLDKYEAVIRLGAKGRRKILVDLDAFDRWVDAHRDKPMKPYSKK